MKPSERNKLDRELLATAVEGADEKTAEAFGEMLIKLEEKATHTLTPKQRLWAKSIAGVGDETYENLISSGKAPRGREVPLPAVLRNLPMKPPGRR